MKASRTKAARALTPGEKREKAKEEARKEVKSLSEKASRMRAELEEIKKKVVEDDPGKGGRIIEPERVAKMQKPLRDIAASNILFQPNEGPQTQFLAAPETDVLYGGAAGGGKAQPLYAKIATPYGWKRMGDIEVGDVISTPNGSTAKVTHLHPQGVQDIYTVTMQDGSTCEVTKEHLFYCKPTRDGKERWKVRSVEELLKSSRTFVLPLGVVEREEVELPVAPYVIGSLLGDGSTTTNSVGFTTADEECVKYLQELVEVSKRKGKYQYGVLGINKELRQLGIIGKGAWDKEVPELYKQGSVEQRLELLRGLMDSDGYVSVDGKVNFTSVSRKLRDDVADLIRSVGGTATLMKGHTLYIRHPDSQSLFRLKRKKIRCHPKTINNRIVSIEKSGEFEAQCITIDSKEQLYVTDNYIVTHNSYAMIVDPLRYAHIGDHRALVLRKTLKELRELIDKSRDLYPKAFPGSKYKESEKVWTFPSGAKLEFGYLEKDSDVYQYQGQAFSWIGFDEITHLASEFPWNYLASRLRTTNPNIVPYMRCVDEGEVLTINGWKDIKDVVRGETIFSVAENGEVVQATVGDVHKYAADEEIVRVRKKNLYMSFTQDHQLVYRKFGKKEHDIVKWSNHTGKSIDVVRSGMWQKESHYTPPFDINPILWARLLGIYVAEGSTPTPRKGNYKVLVTQTQEHKAERIEEELFTHLPYNYCYSGGDFQITNEALHIYLAELGKAHEKKIPEDFLKEASRKQLEEFLDWYSYGDGHWQTPNSGEMYTASPVLKDQLQEIAVKLGYKTQIRHTVYDNPCWNDKWVVAFTRGTTTKVDKGDKRNDSTLEHYKGNVYCLTVPIYHNFIIRQRGYVWVSGNCTANPGGVGHAWVKKRYIEPSEPNTSFVGADGISRRFIPASLYDNPYLTKDGNYERMLRSLPEVHRRRLLEGDWDVNEGAAFPEFDRLIHVIEPFDIPHGWNRIKAIDYGYTSPSCCLWAAIDPDDATVIIYRELYERGLTGDTLKYSITNMERSETRMIPGVLDGAAWNKTGYSGPTIGEQLVRPPYGHRLRPADKNRTAGKIQIHQYLKTNELGKPQLLIFSTCSNLIRELTTIPLSETNSEDVDTHADDHAYDALRYLLMSRPRKETMFEEVFKFKQQASLESVADENFGY